MAKKQDSMLTPGEVASIALQVAHVAARAAREKADTEAERSVDEEVPYRPVREKKGRPKADATGVKNAIAARTAKPEKPVTQGSRRIRIRR